MMSRAMNGSLFNTHRMVSQYRANTWFRDSAVDATSGAM